jgi:hypothetical protein
MKKMYFFLLMIASLQVATAQKGTNYGKQVKTKSVVNVEDFAKTMDTAASWTGVVTGTVKQVCKKEGCWLRLDDGTPEGIMVQMEDHKFLVPKDIDGKTVYVLGTATKTTTSVKMLQHYAEDAGKSKAEIEAITQPKTEVKVQATGVRVI